MCCAQVFRFGKYSQKKEQIKVKAKVLDQRCIKKKNIYIVMENKEEVVNKHEKNNKEGMLKHTTETEIRTKDEKPKYQTKLTKLFSVLT